MEKTAPTTVTIFGVEYRLRSQEDPEFVRRVAQLAEQRMREVSRMQPTASQTRIAVMALLNVAGELLGRERVRAHGAEHEVARVRELAARVEEALASSR